VLFPASSILGKWAFERPESGGDRMAPLDHGTQIGRAASKCSQQAGDDDKGGWRAIGYLTPDRSRRIAAT
jgi:hypothetical protein